VTIKNLLQAADIKEVLTNAMLLEGLHVGLHVSPRQNPAMHCWMQSFHTPIELIAQQFHPLGKDFSQHERFCNGT
jgi:hypothetical protein